MVLQTILLTLTISIGGIVFAICGFGAGVIFHIGYWSFVSLDILHNGHVSTVLVYLTVSTIVVAMGQAFFYRKYILFQPKFAAVYLISTFIATAIGIEVLVKTDNSILTRILGGILLLSFIINVVKDCIFPRLFQKTYNNHSKLSLMTMESDENGANISQLSMMNNVDNNSRYGIPSDLEKYELDSVWKYLILVITCLTSGFLRGLFGVGGPPMMIYFLATNIDRRIIRSLSPFTIGFGSGIPLIIDLLWLNNKFDPSQWVTYLCMLIGFIVGLLFGNLIHSYVDQKLFRNALLFLLFCGAINLILIDLGNISKYSSIVLMFIFVILVILIAIKIVITKTQKSNTEKKLLQAQ